MVSALLVGLFEAQRGRLFGEGYRLTGSLREAEEVLEEAWLRLVSTPQYEIEDLRGWLVGVVGKICLMRLGVRAGGRMPEFVVTAPVLSGAVDELERLARRAEFGIEALAALEVLTAGQRVALVLRDEFGVPVEEVADILEVSVEEARETADAARKALPPMPVVVSEGEHDAAVRRLLAALAAADPDALADALHAEATVVAEPGGDNPLNSVAGARNIADRAVELLRRYRLDISERGNVEFDPVRVNGRLGLLLHERAPRDGVPGWLPRVLAFTVDEGRVRTVRELSDPAKLRRGLRVPLRPAQT
ncbi:sigma factor-like helix-turn-helix DNA-binding protein [Nocardia sp. NPDC004068]|uniref:sigma factor-like helix-turn-helix DNA-binding protein n=1 Tax=Nocardia sp. NPDC004068 TaxID=3364303 RepID=UPI0036AA8A8A